MSRLPIVAVLLTLTIPHLVAVAQDDDEVAPGEMLIAEIRQRIGELDADKFAAREAAAKELKRIGAPALPLLEEAEKHPSEEVRFRAAALVLAIRAGPLGDELEAFCSLPDDRLDVEHGMWLIARIMNPKLKQADLQRQLDEIAARVQAKLGKDVKPAKADPRVVVAALREVLFDELKFAGNKEDFDNPDNSSLERVLATRKGLPITLSHVAVAVARRLDVPIVGLPVTGFYIVKYDGARAPAGFAKEDIFLHPYEGGRILARDDRLKLFPSHDPDVMVPPATSRETLIRMLLNLNSDLDHDPARATQLTQAVTMLELLRAYERKAHDGALP